MCHVYGLLLLPVIVISKTHKRLNARVFLMDETGQNVQIFEEVSFSSYVQHKTEKQTIISTYLVSVRCSEAGGTRLMDVIKKGGDISRMTQ